MAPLIEVRDLSMHYGPVIALDNINLTITTRAPTGLVGRNGAGKTTLLSILAGCIRPKRGSVRILDAPPHQLGLKGRVAILLQDTHFKRGIPVISQLEHFARLQGFSKEGASKEIASLLERLHNASYAGKKPESLSYGQRKRLAIAQAFIGKPELVLLDEPTAGLDPIAANDIRHFIQSFTAETAFIISSHNLYEIEDICSTIAVLDRGRLITCTEISELTKKSNTLNITLDRAASESLIAALSGLAEISDLAADSANREKLTLHFQSEAPDQFQLRIQTIIVEQGFSITHLSRGKGLVDGIIDLFERE